MEVLIERTGNLFLDGDDDDEEEVVESRVSLKDRRVTKSQPCRRRRRSSARFLQLHDDDNDMGNDNKYGGADVPHDNLGEVYQNAIRMNAENRINASNSWNLTLIDHMDRFLMSSGRLSSAALEDTLGPVTGVNFTKASCTLDASVKIYSYRVDDVHLTSYKVLANLNRTDASGTTTSTTNAAANSTTAKQSKTASEGDSLHDSRHERRAARNNTETLETNTGKQLAARNQSLSRITVLHNSTAIFVLTLCQPFLARLPSTGTVPANINVHKLDAAFDIDPLFHKMSKTFDEGGAKGLLLANLGVGNHGCNIVFDSTLDTDELPRAQFDNEHITTNTNTCTSVDVSVLTAKLDALLNGQPIHQLHLVPQLAMLRSEFALLKDEGFVDQSNPVSTHKYTYPYPYPYLVMRK